VLTQLRHQSGPFERSAPARTAQLLPTSRFGFRWAMPRRGFSLVKMACCQGPRSVFNLTKTSDRFELPKMWQRRVESSQLLLKDFDRRWI
jgi:hypothetical protein